MLFRVKEKTANRVRDACVSFKLQKPCQWWFPLSAFYRYFHSTFDSFVSIIKALAPASQIRK
nr:hypothetical protein Q903MT_gene4641 [Picea sitchensis]